MVGEPMVAKVVEVDRRRNRLILSERAAAKEGAQAAQGAADRRAEARRYPPGPRDQPGRLWRLRRHRRGGWAGAPLRDLLEAYRPPEGCAQGRRGSLGQGSEHRSGPQSHQPIDARARTRSVADRHLALDRRPAGGGLRSPS